LQCVFSHAVHRVDWSGVGLWIKAKCWEHTLFRQHKSQNITVIEILQHQLTLNLVMLLIT